MEIRGGTKALLLGGAILLGGGLVSGEGAFIIGGLVMVLAAGVQALAMTFTLAHCAHAVQVERTVSHRILRQGSDIGVTTVFHASIPAGYHLLIRDEPPAGCTVVEGGIESSVTGPGEVNATLHYTMRALARGELSFRGITLTLTSPFYREQLFMGSGQVTKPVLMVQPAPAFATEKPSSLIGSQELDRLRAIQGQGIRAYRAFRTGDDVRAIDWKLSAKHGKLMLREYTGRAGGIPFLILDLPASVDPSHTPGYERLIAGLTAEIELALRDYHRTDVLVISGGRVIYALSPLRDARAWYRLQHQLVPGEGYLSLYRFQDLPSLRSFQQRTVRSGAARSGDEQVFLSRVGSIFTSSIAAHPQPLLERQVLAAFRRSGEREVVIFSMVSGDLSHLHLLATIARSLRMRVHLRHPRGIVPSAGISSWVDTLEVVA